MMQNLKIKVLVLAVLCSGLFSACRNEDPLDANIKPESLEDTNANCQPQRISWDAFAYDQEKVNHEMTFSWKAGAAAGKSKFKFEFLVNNQVVAQAIDLVATTHSISEVITLDDLLEIRVYEDCGNGYSSFQTTGKVHYLNAVNTDDIVFRAKSSTAINDFCPLSCNYAMLEDDNIFNADGTLIDVSTLSSSFVFYDFAAIKTNCLSCQLQNGVWSTAVVDPGGFLNCVGQVQQVIYDDYRECL